jgi:hypothetical protein
MSYRGKQSCLFAAISIYFVIFASTASNARPPQAIPEEAKACKAISNDQQRLQCFDGLFADKPNQPNADDKSANEGNWQIEEGKSPTDGSPLIVAANLVGDTVLILRCQDQHTEAAFSTKYSYLGSRSVGRAAFASNPVEFIRMLPDDANLFIRTSRRHRLNGF